MCLMTVITISRAHRNRLFLSFKEGENGLETLGFNSPSLNPENVLPQWQQKIADAENNVGRYWDKALDPFIFCTKCNFLQVLDLHIFLQKQPGHWGRGCLHFHLNLISLFRLPNGNGNCARNLWGNLYEEIYLGVGEFTFSAFRHIGLDVKHKGVERNCFGTSRMPERVGDKRLWARIGGINRQ